MLGLESLRYTVVSGTRVPFRSTYFLDPLYFGILLIWGFHEGVILEPEDALERGGLKPQALLL